MIRFFNKKKTNWLAGYPVYDAPHVGVGRTLSQEQANENLEYLLATKQTRKDSLSALLAQFNIDLAAGCANNTPEKLINELYEWTGEYWKFYQFDEHRRQDWCKSDRRGDDLIYSVAMDTAIALGDLLIQHRPTYFWGVDLDSSNILMTSFRRCVVMAPRVNHDSMAIADIEVTVAERVFNPNKPHWKWANQWQRMMDGYLSGAHEGVD